ncbi:MAG: hypothetical protein KKA42_00955 [candidate division Zixibacteria bacterium]|nr:hypothetical protein [candidate division Zixibacteria bacterium]
MISFELMFYCFLGAGAYLFVLSLVLQWVDRVARVTEGIPPEMLESIGLGWTVTNFMMESLFYVIIPTIAYGFFYLIIPFYGIRAGMAATLFAFAVGAAPALLGLSVRVKVPMSYLLFVLLSVLLKLGGCLIIISYLYSL